MALVMSRLAASDRYGRVGVCARRSTAGRRIMRPPSFTPLNIAAPMRDVGANAVIQQTTTRHVVKLTATTADFERVMARLAASEAFATAQANNGADLLSPPPAGAKPWSGLLGGLFGGLRSQPHSVQSDKLEHPEDDDSPLNHAVVMFTATWCGPCSVVYRELKLAATRLQGRPPTAVLVMDVEKNKELASELGIKALPTLLYLGRDGSRGPIFTQGPVSSSFILDTLERTAGFGGRDVKAKWLKL